MKPLLFFVLMMLVVLKLCLIAVLAVMKYVCATIYTCYILLFVHFPFQWHKAKINEFLAETPVAASTTIKSKVGYNESVF
jgi:hypothetical protein